MSERKFVVCRNDDDVAENEHYSDCRFRGVPFVVVNTKRKYASVCWDHLTLPSDLDYVLMAKRDEIAQEILAAYRRRRGRTSVFQIGALTGFVERLDRQSAEALAEEVYDIVTAHLAAAA